MEQLKNVCRSDHLLKADPFHKLLIDDGKIKPNGTEIKKRRKTRCMTQDRLSEETGLARKTIRNLESNPTYRCRASTINILSKFYGIEPHLLIKQEDGSSIKLLRTAQEMIDVNTKIATSARKFLACVGSRCSDENYMRIVEETLIKYPTVIHYRVMALPPFKKIFQDHLLKLLHIRNPVDRTHGYKTLHIGFHEDTVRQPEYGICVNETTVLIVLPSMFGFGEYNTALLIEDVKAAERYFFLAKSLYLAGRFLETKQAILQLGLVKDGELHE